MKNKPIFLNLLAIRFPLTAIVSIFHRVSGILLFLAIPGLLYCLQQSQSSQAGFDHISHLFSLEIVKFVVLCISSLFVYHVLAGIRHMLMDYGIGESKSAARLSSIIVFIIFLILFIIMGKYILW